LEPRTKLPVGLPASQRPATGWLISPSVDLVLFANLLWPVVALLAWLSPSLLEPPLTGIQVYFLSTPHRWVTLVLVFLDRSQFAAQPRRFTLVGLGLLSAGALLVALGTYFPVSGNTLALFMMVDYAWNSWHFASQHAGISRIYGRLCKANMEPKSAEFEKLALRVLVIWAFIRLAAVVALRRETPFAGLSGVLSHLTWLDPVFAGPAVWLLFQEIRAYAPERFGRLAYIGSVVAIYVAQMVALNLGYDKVTMALFLAGAVFHALEYLAICGWAMAKKRSGVWNYLAPRAALFVLVFAAVLGITHITIERQSVYTWTLITLLVSLLHYGYDGMIWKSRPAAKPAPLSAN